PERDVHAAPGELELGDVGPGVLGARAPFGVLGVALRARRARARREGDGDAREKRGDAVRAHRGVEAWGRTNAGRIAKVVGVVQRISRARGGARVHWLARALAASRIRAC